MLAVIIIFLPSLMYAQISKQDSIWSPFKFFVGKWEGNGKSGSGDGKYERSYQFIFNARFIEVKNKSTYPPTEKNLKGEVHEDLGYISCDKVRKLTFSTGSIRHYIIGKLRKIESKRQWNASSKFVGILF